MANLYAPDRYPIRHWLVPIASTMLGSALALLPFVAQVPVWPAFGLLMALGWRLFRPEMWGAWMALPLGLFDDLVTGAPLGTAMALWTIAFLALDIADHRRLWRDPIVDWQLATLSILFASAGAWGLASLAGGAGPIWAAAIQAVLGILLFPAAARLCATLDHWRLGGGAANAL